MVATTALSDEEVGNQISHMVAFIQQEASEKTNEIYVKAEEEFNIEKGRLVQSEKLKIMALYDRKEKHFEVQKKIAYSNALNESRLKVLQQRNDHYEAIGSDVRAALLTALIKDSSRYQDLLEQLIVQGLYQLLEPEVYVRCREQDSKLVEKAMVASEKKFQAQLKRSVKLILDTRDYLSADGLGGVEMYVLGGRIRSDNKLESRLNNVLTQMQPDIRRTLFGEVENRASHKDGNQKATINLIDI